MEAHQSTRVKTQVGEPLDTTAYRAFFPFINITGTHWLCLLGHTYREWGHNAKAPGLAMEDVVPNLTRAM